MAHPLLKKIDIMSSNHIDDIYNKLIDLGFFTVKKHDNLLLVKYKKEYKYSEHDYVRNSRGIIIDYKAKKIINSSINGVLSEEDFIKYVPEWKDWVIEEKLDGTLINVFYNNNKWNICTKSCINADETRFRSTKTYRELFDELIDINSLDLDKSYSYSFLLRHIENRNISVIKRNELIHLESTNNVTGDKVKINLGFKSPKIIKIRDIINIYNINNLDELKNVVKNLPTQHPGFTVYSIDRKYRFNIDNPKYIELSKIVSTQKDPKFIVLDSLYRNNNIYLILENFPEYNNIAIDINNKIYELSIWLHEVYKTSKVKRQYVNIRDKYKKLLSDLHNIYKERKNKGINSPIVYSDVCDLIRNYDTKFLYSILFK